MLTTRVAPAGASLAAAGSWSASRLVSGKWLTWFPASWDSVPSGGELVFVYREAGVVDNDVNRWGVGCYSFCGFADGGLRIEAYEDGLYVYIRLDGLDVCGDFIKLGLGTRGQDEKSGIVLG